jgi:hypothetical protein
MPFTPLHMGPGIAIKAIARRRFSLMVFGWSQILMDLQPLKSWTRHITIAAGQSLQPARSCRRPAFYAQTSFRRR